MRLSFDKLYKNSGNIFLVLYRYVAIFIEICLESSERNKLIFPKITSVNHIP